MMEINIPKVSIVAANYNNSRYVLDCLDSIRKQTYPNIELIIVDDGSSDDSAEKIREWLKGYTKPYKYIVHETNKGICPTCNELIRNASGKYISMIATDDMYLPEKISSQVEIMEKQDETVAFVYSDTWMIDETSHRKPGSYMVNVCNIPVDKLNIKDVATQLSENNFLHWITVLVRKNVYEHVGIYDENLTFEDYDMSLRIIEKYKIVFTENIQTLYRVHKTSFSGKTNDWSAALLPLYLKHSHFDSFKTKARDIISRKYFDKNPEAGKMALNYYSVTGQKIPYHTLVVLNVNPRLVNLLVRVKAFVRKSILGIQPK